MASFTISPDFGYVILASAAISLQCVLSAIGVSKLRKKYNVPYPDSGDGRHAAKLTDEEWEDFHNAQRAHRNYTEQIGVTQALLITSGLVNPKAASYAAALYIVGRQFYYHGYVNSGANGRVKGVILVDIGLLGLLGNSIYSGLCLLGYC